MFIYVASHYVQLFEIIFTWILIIGILIMFYYEAGVCKLVRFQIFTLASNIGLLFFNSKIYGFVWMGQLEDNGFEEWDLKLFTIINELYIFVGLKTHVDGGLTLFVYSHV